MDDDEAIARLLGSYLGRVGYPSDWVTTSEGALEAVRRRTYELLIVDYHLGRVTGLQLAQQLEQEQRRRIPVVVMTADGHLDTAVAALRAGAADFLTKPFELSLLQAVVTRVMAHHLTRLELDALKSVIQRGEQQHGLIGNHRSMVTLRGQLARLARAPNVVLITGESGTGKELAARALHAESPRSRGPLVAINCGALPGTLLESELFGHVKGAFTDARAERLGVFREANHGTLFLDEIAELPLPLQAALLRVLQDHRVRPVGANREVPTDVRVIAATNKDLRELVQQQRFRHDLLFRLDVLRLDLPPLRARGDDVLLLAAHFLAVSGALHRRQIAGWSPEVAERLLAHDWPGNVRELQNVIERAVLSSEGTRLEAWHFPSGMGERPPPKLADGWPLTSLAALEQRHIEHVLGAVGGNRQRAADLLGIDRVTLYRKLKRKQSPLPPDTE